MNTPPPLPQSPQTSPRPQRSWFRIITWYFIALIMTGSLSSLLRTWGVGEALGDILGIALFVWALAAPWRSSSTLNLPVSWWQPKPIQWWQTLWWLALAGVLIGPALRLYQFANPPTESAFNQGLGFIGQLSTLTLGICIACIQLLADPMVLLPTAGVLGLFLFLGRRHQQRNGQLPGWAYGLCLIALLLGNPILDMHPEFFVAQAVIVALTLQNSRRQHRGPSLAVKGSYTLTIAALLGWLSYGNAGFGVVLLAAGFALFSSYIFSGIRIQILPRKLTWIVLGIATTQILASTTPYVTGIWGNPTTLSSASAYGYCIQPDSPYEVWFTFPNCSAFPRHHQEAIAHEMCRAGTVEAFNFRDDPPTPVAKHAPFGPDYYGRLEKPICLGESILLGLTDVWMDSAKSAGSTLSLNAANGSISQKHILGTDAGHTLGHDPNSGWVYAVDEFSGTLQRFQPETGEVQSFGPPLDNMSLTLDGEPISQNRNSLFVTEHYFGDEVIELKLADGQEKRRYRHNNGGGWATTVDDGTARLYVTGMWSLDIFDLRTGQHIKRHRTGFGARAPLIAPVQNRIFVPMTLEGTIRVYDRDSLALVTTLPVGMGIRNLLMTVDESKLIGSNGKGTLYWSPEP